MKQRYFVYKTTNLINGKIYIGKHSTNNLEDNYLGSGTHLNNSINKYGKENFKREILEFFDTEQEAYDYEAEIVTKEFVLREDTYNHKLGGKGGTIGMVTVKDKEGKTFCVFVDDPRYLLGELIPVRTNFVNVKNKEGVFSSVRIDNAEYLSGGLIPITTGYRGVFKDNTYTIIPKDKLDLFLAEGWKEGKPPILILRGKNHPNFGKKRSSEMNKANRERGKLLRAISRDKINKRCHVNDLEHYLKQGWENKIYHEDYTHIFKDGKEKRVLLADLEKFLLDGWQEGHKWRKVKGLINPKGKLIKVAGNIKKYCRENNLVYDLLKKYENIKIVESLFPYNFKTRKNVVKNFGWTYLGVIPENFTLENFEYKTVEKILDIPRWKIVSPENKIYKIFSLSAFCDKNNLSKRALEHYMGSSVKPSFQQISQLSKNTIGWALYKTGSFL